MKKSYFILYLLITFLACKEQKTDYNTGAKNKSVQAQMYLTDTITYDVVIKEPYLDFSYVDNSRLNSKRLIDNLFNSIYSKNYIAYDYDTEKEISVDKIKNLEESGKIDRESIGKLQFTELWKYNSETGQMTKDVLSLILAYEVYNSDSTLKFYKPLFKIKYK
jgi:hypothetical protein